MVSASSANDSTLNFVYSSSSKQIGQFETTQFHGLNATDESGQNFNLSGGRFSSRSNEENEEKSATEIAGKINHFGIGAVEALGTELMSSSFILRNALAA